MAFVQTPAEYAQKLMAHCMGYAQKAIDMLPQVAEFPGIGDDYIAELRAILEATPSYQGTLTNNALRDAALADDAEAYAEVYVARVAHGHRELAVKYMQCDIAEGHRCSWAKATGKGVAEGFAHRVLDVLQRKAETSDHVEALIAAGLIQLNEQSDLFGEHEAQAADNSPALSPAGKANREAWLNRFAKAAGKVFAKAGYPLPANVRISVGFPMGAARSKAIGQCWDSRSSGDGHFEIFIHPSLGDSARVADVLTHELIHAAVGLEDGHGKLFTKCARALGLEGKMTATVAGARWEAWALPILAKLGELPHAALAGGESNAPKKQGTRMLKVTCSDAECGFSFRTTKKHLDGRDELHCPVPSCGAALTWECPDDDDLGDEDRVPEDNRMAACEGQEGELEALERLKGWELGRALKEAEAARGHTVHVRFQGGGWFYIRDHGAPIGHTLRSPEVRQRIARLRGLKA